jgi:hypothetical protein
MDVNTTMNPVHLQLTPLDDGKNPANGYVVILNSYVDPIAKSHCLIGTTRRYLEIREPN